MVITRPKKLQFDGHANLGKKRERMEKVCIICGDTYIGVKASRLCSKRECKQASNRAYQKRTLAETLEKRRMKQRASGVEVREYNNDHMIPKRKSDMCEYCGDKISDFSGYQQYCETHRNAYKRKIVEYINNSTPYDIGAVIESHLGENDGLINIIQDMYPNYDQLQHQRIFDECYQELLNRYGREYFES